MANTHQVFTQSLRNIMQNEEKRLRETDQKRGDEGIDEDNLLLQEMLEAKFDELFGPVDEDDE